MANVQFDEENQYTSRKIFGERIKPGMVSFLISKGVVKDQKQAGHILLIVTTVCFALSFYLFANAFGWLESTETYVPTPEELQSLN